MKRGAELPTGADGHLLVELAEIDESLGERGAVWKDLVHRLEALRREIVVSSAKHPRSRSRAARKKPRDDDDHAATPSAPSRDEGHATTLTREFEAAQRDTEQRRAALHGEMERLRRRREAVLRQLPVAVSRAYRSLLAAGRAPAIADVANGTCRGCEAALPESDVEALRQGSFVACAHCERLLHLTGPVE